MTPPAEPSPPPQTGSAASRVFGVILMIIGFLLLSAAGLCTLIFGGAILSEGFSLEEFSLVLGYAAVPMIIGALIAWGGYALWRRGTPR